MDFENLVTLVPANKQSAFITSQSNCSDDFLLSQRECLKVLGLRKKYFMDAICKLREELGINRIKEQTGQKAKYPPKILKHPDYKKFIKLKASLTKLDDEIFKTRQSIKDAPLPFSERFVTRVKEKYPNIFEEIKQEVKL